MTQLAGQKRNWQGRCLRTEEPRDCSAGLKSVERDQVDETFNFAPCKDHSCRIPDLLPCNDPTCDDVIPCPIQSEWCDDPLKCLGEICYDENCPSLNNEEHQFCCDQACDAATRCASPCFSQECDTSNCYASCSEEIIPLCNSNVPHHHPPDRAFEWHCGDPCACIDPRCLEINHLSVPHKHAEDGTQVEIIPDSILQANEPTVELRGWINSFPGKEFTSSGSGRSGLQTLLEASNLQLVNDRDHTGVYESISPSTPPLSHSRSSPSSTATPRTSTFPSPAFSTLMKTSLPVANPDPLVCNWIVSSNTKQNSVQICGEAFADAESLHEHVEKMHIDSIGTRDNPKQEVLGDSESSLPSGFNCLWASCPRLHDSSAQPFLARPKLKRHVQIHTKYKPFACPYQGCDTRMKTRDALAKHIRTHTGERPYKCTFAGCTKTFATSTELKTHMVVHSGTKPHMCTVCGERFADSSNLSKHRKVHMTVGMWRCLECGVRMKRWDQIRRHAITLSHNPAIVEDPEERKKYRALMEREWQERSEKEGSSTLV